MNDIANSMIKKGYLPLMADKRGGVGFRGSLGSQGARLSRPVWFDTGRKMKSIDDDGNPIMVSRTVCARDELSYSQCVANGWSPIETIDDHECGQ